MTLLTVLVQSTTISFSSLVVFFNNYLFVPGVFSVFNIRKLLLAAVVCSMVSGSLLLSMEDEKEHSVFEGTVSDIIGHLGYPTQALKKNSETKFNFSISDNEPFGSFWIKSESNGDHFKSESGLTELPLSMFVTKKGELIENGGKITGNINGNHFELTRTLHSTALHNLLNAIKNFQEKPKYYMFPRKKDALHPQKRLINLGVLAKTKEDSIIHGKNGFKSIKDLTSHQHTK